MKTCWIALFPFLLVPCCLALANQAPAPATAVTSTENSEVQQFQKIEDTWSNAINQRDQYSLELVLSPLFVDVSARGDITTRNQQLARVISGDDKTMSIEQRVITVRLLGDIAVASGTYEFHHRVDTAQVDEKGVFTHVFERVRGNWMCINSQRTLVKEDQTAKGKQSKKRNDAPSPFHLPFFGKNEK